MSDQIDNVTGSLHRFDDGRLVFLGTCQSQPDAWFVGFRNVAGNVTKLKLSHEAMLTLTEMVAEYPPEAPEEFIVRPSTRSAEFQWREVALDELRDGLKHVVDSTDQETTDER